MDFFSADSPRAFDSRNRRHVLGERSLCQGKTKYHIVCLQKGCHFSAAVWSVSSLLAEPLCQKPVTGRDGESTYILYLKWYGQHLHLPVRGLFAQSCSTILPESPSCGARQAGAVVCPSAHSRGARVSILMRSILHISKEKHTCSLWRFSQGTLPPKKQAG